jgi:hypothetical protein
MFSAAAGFDFSAVLGRREAEAVFAVRRNDAVADTPG